MVKVSVLGIALPALSVRLPGATVSGACVIVLVVLFAYVTL